LKVVASVSAFSPRRRAQDHLGKTQRVVGVAAAATLAVDAYVHLHDAGFYDSVKTSVISQGTLFRAEAVFAIAIGLALLIRPRRIWWTAALLILASAFGAVMLYRYVNVGVLGPLPNMYEPTWVLPGKLLSAWAEGAGTALTAIGLLLSVRGHRRSLRGRTTLDRAEVGRQWTDQAAA
jgi:NhaP-type Na+/H+ or K+/H+ antiporter